MSVDSLALTRPDATLTMDVLRAQMEAAKRYVDSGLLPSAIRTPQQAMTIMQAGREIGVPPTYALRNIHVIEGKPTVSAELLMALVRRTYGQSAIRVAEATPLQCTVEYREQGWDGVSSLTFSIADAEAAQLAGKAMWRKYPRAMLRSRAVSEAVRMAFPECIAGLYTAEEMGAEVTVTPDGSLEITEVASESRPAPQQAAPLTIANDAVADLADTVDAEPVSDPEQPETPLTVKEWWAQLVKEAEAVSLPTLGQIKAIDPEAVSEAQLQRYAELLDERLEQTGKA